MDDLSALGAVGTTRAAPSASPSDGAPAGFIEERPLVHVGDLVDPAACRAILAEFAGAQPWKEAQITTWVEEGATGRALKSILDLDRRLARRIHFCDIDLDARPATRAALDLIKAEVGAMARARFGFRTEDFGDEEIVHYPQGGKFTPHSDANSLKPYRALSIVFYLNEGYQGGRTGFPELDYACTPKTGRVLVFPSQLLHGGEPVLAGEKYIIVLWAFYPGGK